MDYKANKYTANLLRSHYEKVIFPFDVLQSGALAGKASVFLHRIFIHVPLDLIAFVHVSALCLLMRLRSYLRSYVVEEIVYLFMYRKVRRVKH